MNERFSLLLNGSDPGLLSRRQLLRILGVAAVATPLGRALGQGSCGGANAGTPRCNTVPFPPPFEATGWKTVLMDHFKLQVAEVEREAAYYEALMGWKVRSFDGNVAWLDIGDWAAVEIRGGLAVPSPVPAAAAGAGDTAGRGGAAGGRGGGGRGRGGGRRAIWDGHAWGIEPWNTATVERELTRRGLNPVADHRPADDFYSFRVKDPDGFNVWITNGNKGNRRTTPATGKLSIPRPFEPTGWRTVYLDHISFQVTSYKESVAWYTTLLGWVSQGDEGSQSDTQVSPEIGGLIIRGGNANAPGGLTAGRRGGGAGDTVGRAGQPAAAAPLVRSAVMNHISFGLADFDHVKVREELQKRGLNARVDTGGSEDISTARYKSYHTTTPNGFDLQISNVISP